MTKSVVPERAYKSGQFVGVHVNGDGSKIHKYDNNWKLMFCNNILLRERNFN